jgi:hypothetical protein
MIESPSIFSLSHAVQAIAQDAGIAHDLDAINALLGVSVMCCAVPGERDMSRWPLYARDAFLIEGARALGLTIRPIHPPEAARGLDRTQEFGQHFDASYRPLIQRALEHGQPVLAWRGWARPHDMHWGIITEACAEGAGFGGRIFCEDPSVSAKGVAVSGGALSLLERPAIQLYVVESIAEQVGHETWLPTALKHASAVLNNQIAECFGVITGPTAYDRWQGAIDELLLRDTGGGTLISAETASLARSTVTAHESAVRFLGKHRVAAPLEWHSRLATLERECQNVVMTLKPLADAGRVGDWLATLSGRAIVAAKITAAREATHLMQTALIGLA